MYISLIRIWSLGNLTLSISEQNTLLKYSGFQMTSIISRNLKVTFINYKGFWTHIK